MSNTINNDISKDNIKNTGLLRKTIDKYYTSDDAVIKCMEFVSQYIKISDNDICIEPSAGNGSFIKHIKTLFKNYNFYDLEPGSDEIIKQDYLSLDEEFGDYDKIHVIGNPPFGRQSSTAIKFIKKSCSYSDSISFILPKSFNKDSMKKHFPLNFHLVCSYDLPINSFLVDGLIYDVPCVFQIWIKKNEIRDVPIKLFPIKFLFVKKDEFPDISFRRVGVNAGTIDKETVSKSSQSHYFIKFDDKLSNTKFKQLSKIKFECKNNTVGPKSISKQELIKEFNKYME